VSVTLAERESTTGAAASGKGPVCSMLSGMCGVTLPAVEGAQARWAMTDVSARVRVLKAARHAMAADAEAFAEVIPDRLARTKADTLVTELLPLLDACKFLEREAKAVLATRRLGSDGRPFWLSGVTVEIRREAVGHVLVIGPGNFPLFLPGVQVLQALAAGNSVTWKPGAGGWAVAELMARHLRTAGLPEGLLRVTGESVDEARMALAGGMGMPAPDKVIFTGSSESGQQVLAGLAKTATPAVVELSGADAILLMPTPDLQRVAKAVAFGLRLNGGAVCMSPRRLFASRTDMKALRPLLEAELAKVPAVALEARTAEKLRTLLDEAVRGGAVVVGEFNPEAQRPLLVTKAQAHMKIACSDIFAPVIALLECESMLHALEQYAACPYALTASIFCSKGDEKQARKMAGMLRAGTVLINDLIAPTADPRVPFGGRGASGYGVTRGAEGLLEMTVVKTVIVRRGGGRRHYEATTDSDATMFSSLIGVVHGKGLGARFAALVKLAKAGRQHGGPVN
jgi:acyl-CoA reductase-like NAD-dependent aldehyde dehydrogenase